MIATDVLLEGGVQLLKRNPRNATRMLRWLMRGKAQLKARVADETTMDVTHLPYRPQVLEYLQAMQAQGRRIVLATAADARVAQQVAERLGLFDRVLASDGEHNLAGERKRQRLVAEFGEKGFDYVGNARPDLAVWRSARAAVVVGGGAALWRRVAGVTEIVHHLEGQKCVPPTSSGRRGARHQRHLPLRPVAAGSAASAQGVFLAPMTTGMVAAIAAAEIDEKSFYTRRRGSHACRHPL